MTNTIFASSLTNLMHSGVILAVPNPPIGSFAPPQSVAPFIILAILIDALIAALWYMVGAILNNQSVKAGARSEAIQVFGTALIAGILMAMLLVFGTIYYNIAVSTPPAALPSVLNPASVMGVCTNLESTNVNLYFAQEAVTTSFLSEQPTATGVSYPQTPSVCGIVQDVATAPGATAIDPTALMDYPLATATVVNANLTNQVAGDLSDVFIIDAYLNFQKWLWATVSVCIGSGWSCAGAPVAGIIPLPFAPSYISFTQYRFPALNGLDYIEKTMVPTVTTLLYTSTAAFVAQLIFMNFFMYAWPYLLFIGLALRGLFFTRKIGGLFIAVAIGAIFIYPTFFGIEYLTASNPDLFPALESTPISYCGTPQYYVNFFVLPQISAIAQDCGCWPSGGLLYGESQTLSALTGYDIPGVPPAFWAYYIPTFLSDALSGKNLFNSLPSLPNQFQSELSSTGVPFCPTGSYNTNTGQGTGGEGMALGIAQAYGVIGVSAYFIPIINVIMTIASIIGISGLLGGDVDLAGLSRFV